MNRLLINYLERKLLPETAGWTALRIQSPSGGRPFEAESECSFESIRIRAETVTPLLREILNFRPPIHWGINE